MKVRNELRIGEKEEVIMDNNEIYKADYSLHDNIITYYKVDFENSKLIMYTTDKYENYTQKNQWIIEFYDVLTHDFKCIMKGSIIFDIEVFGIDKFMEDEKLTLKELREIFPFRISDDISKIKEYLINNNYKYVRMNSSYGMFGWILAKDYKVIHNL